MFSSGSFRDSFLSGFYEENPDLLSSKPQKYEIRRRNQVKTRQPNLSKFKVMLNVKQFRPEEIDIKTVGDDFVVVHGKHEEQADGHGFVSREFTRRYKLPDGVKIQEVKSLFSKDGVLTIEAPVEAPEPSAENEIIIPVIPQKRATYEESAKFREENYEF